MNAIVPVGWCEGCGVATHNRFRFRINRRRWWRSRWTRTYWSCTPCHPDVMRQALRDADS